MWHVQNICRRVRKRGIKVQRKGFGKKDTSKRGLKAGGRGRNKTSTCRHPKRRKK